MAQEEGKPIAQVNIEQSPPSVEQGKMKIASVFADEFISYRLSIPTSWEIPRQMEMSYYCISITAGYVNLPFWICRIEICPNQSGRSNRGCRLTESLD